ncbi:MAG: hypothetical protein R3F62_24790 [Planctomycetota bacterium]
MLPSGGARHLRPAPAQNTILRNFPLAGHLRYLAESIAPEIQQ